MECRQSKYSAQRVHKYAESFALFSKCKWYVPSCVMSNAQFNKYKSCVQQCGTFNVQFIL